MRHFFRYVFLLIFAIVANVSIANVGSSNNTELYRLGDETFQMAEAVATISANNTGTTSINSLPDATLNGTGSGSVFGGIPVFETCTNTTSLFTFTNGSTTIASNLSYTISWGDGSPDFVSASWTSTTHIYRIGSWNLVYTIRGTDGSSITKPYIVFVGTSPTVSLGKPDSTDICNPTSLTFPITGTRNNPQGTTYTVTFTDGSAPQIFNHPPPSSVTHLFNKTSCGVTSSSFTNSFSATILAENPCGKYEAVVAPIYVSSPPVADFILPSTVNCVDNEVCMTNTSTGGSIAGSSGCLNPNLVWSISPAIGFTLASGSLGNDFSSTDQSKWTTGTNVICPKFSIPGTYIVKLKVGNHCGIDQKIDTICVETPITPQFTLATTTGCTTVDVSTINSTVVANACTTPKYNWEVSYTAGYCGISSAYTYTNGTSASSFNPSFQFTNPGTYTIKLSISNSCGTQTTSKTVIVEKKPPTVTINNIPDFCGSAVINPSAVVTNCAPPTSPVTYAWSFPGGIPATSNTEVPGTITYSSPGNYTVSFNLTNECGVSVTATKTFAVNVVPVLTNISLAQTICSGHQTDLVILTSDIPGTTFSWTATATAGITGFTPSGNTNTLPVQTITTANNVTGTVNYAITPMFGACPGTVRNYVITVNPAAAFTSQPVPSAVCQGGTPASLSVTFINGATPIYQWYANTVDNNFSGTAILGATNATYNPPTSTIGSIYYYCIITFSSGVCTEITSNTANVTITAVPAITTQPTSSQDLCIGGTIPTPLSANYVGGAGTPTYQWYSNGINSNVGGTAIYGATNLSYTPPAFISVGTYYYYVVLTFSGSGCNSVISNIAKVNVVNDPIVSEQPLLTQTVCLNSDPVNLKVTASGGAGAYLYQWYSNTVNNTTTGSVIPGAIGATYKPVTSTLGTGYYYCLITQGAGLSCDVKSETAEVIVIPQPTFTSQPQPNMVCRGGTLTPLSVTYSGGVGAPTYQWYGNLIDNTASGMLIPGATSATYTPITTSLGTFYYYCIISFSSGTCSSIISNTATIIVSAIPAITAQPTPSQNLCIGGTTATPLSVNYTGGTGTPTYQWYSNTINTNVGGTIIASGTSSTYTPAAFTALGTYYYYVVLTFSGSGCTSVTSDVAQLNIVSNPSISSQPLTTQTVCQSVAPADLTVAATGGLNVYLYQWYVNAVNNTTSGTLIPGATGATFTPFTTTVGTAYYYCEVTQGAGLGCNVTSATSAVVVVPALSFKQYPISSNVCQNGIPSTLFVDYENGVGTPTYQWYSNTDDNTATGIPIGGAINSTYIPSTTTLGTIYYYCTITLSLGTCTSITSKTANVTVTTVPAITTHPTATQSICVGGTIAAPLSVEYSGGAGTITFQWYSNTINSTIGGTPISGATNSTFSSPAFTVSGTYYYYVVINFSGSGCSSITSNTSEIVVSDDPFVSLQPLVSQTLCINYAPSDLTVSASGGIGSFLHQWYSNSVKNTTTGTLITGATSATYKPSTSTIGISYYYCLITQPLGLGCNATSDLAEVIVVPEPTFTSQPLSNTVCKNATPTALSVNYTGGEGVPSYQWYSNTIDNTISGSAIPGETNASFIPSTSTVGTTYYYCTISLSSGSCTGLTSGTAVFTVNPNPQIATKSSTICSGTAFSVTPNNLTGDIVPTGTIYIWSYPAIIPAGSITGASVQSTPQTSISQTLTNSTNGLATATYIVTPISGSCVGANFNVVVTVNPAININTTVNNITCLGANNGSIQAAISGGVPFGGGTPYTISWTGPNGFTSVAANISGLVAGIYNLTVDDAAGCPVSKSYTIVEPTAIIINTDNKKDIPCFGANNGEIGITVTGGTAPYNYTWTKNTVFYSNAEDLSNLGPGVYELTASDVNSCAPKKATFTILEPSALGLNLVSQTNVLCYGDAIGAITVNVSGGTPFEKTPGVFSYSFMWMGPNGFTSSSQNLVNIVEGAYNLVVTDFLGCSKTLTVNITQSPEIVLDVTTTAISCYGANNATIILAISGGNAPYQIQWSNAGSGTFQGNLAAGNYVITVIDNLGCQKTRTVNIPEAPIYNISPKVTNISCFGTHDGVINLNLIGGKVPVSVVWSDSPTTATVRTNLGPGSYTVAISDGTPCYINNSFVIVEPQPMVLSANLTNAIDCNGINSGAIDLLVAGGTAPYKYLWSNGVVTEDIKNVPAGIYTVTVTDKNSCSVSGQYTLTRPLPIEISVVTADGYDCTIQKTIKTCIATVKEGVPPYQLTWSRGTISGLNNEIMVTTQSGLVDLQVVDALGCSKSYSFNVDLLKLGIDYTVSDCNKHIYEFNALVLNTQENYTYAWDFGDGSSSTLKNPQHVFLKAGIFNLQLTVSSTSCIAIFQKTINVESQPVLTLDREPLLCLGDSVVLHALGANFYRWSNGTVADSLVIKESGEYNVIGRTLDGCIDTLKFTANYYDSFNYTIQTDKVEVTTDGTPIRIWSEAIPYSNYIWDFGDGMTQTAGSEVNHLYDASKAGHYDIKLKVINPNGCTENVTKRIWITNNSIINTFSPNGDGTNDIFMKGWHLKVYNRNGLFIFEGKDGWDGTNNGKDVMADTYFFVVYFESESGTKSRSGYVTVIR